MMIYKFSILLNTISNKKYTMTKQIKVNKEIHGMLVLLKKETKSASINDAIEILLVCYKLYDSFINR